MVNHPFAEFRISEGLKDLAEEYGWVFIRLFGFPLDPVTRLRMWKILTFLSQLGISNKKILDIGCSFGIYTFELAKRARIVTGIDINREIIELAKRIREVLAVENVHFENADLLESDFPSEEFDIVTMIEVLEHIKRDLEAIQKIQGILKEDGMLVISVPYTKEAVEYVTPQPSLTIGKKEVRMGFLGENHFRSGYNLERLCYLLETNGFRVLDHFYTKATSFLPRDMILFPIFYIPSLVYNYLGKNRVKITVIARKTS